MISWRGPRGPANAVGSTPSVLGRAKTRRTRHAVCLPRGSLVKTRSPPCRWARRPNAKGGIPRQFTCPTIVTCPEPASSAAEPDHSPTSVGVRGGTRVPFSSVALPILAVTPSAGIRRLDAGRSARGRGLWSVLAPPGLGSGPGRCGPSASGNGAAGGVGLAGHPRMTSTIPTRARAPRARAPRADTGPAERLGVSGDPPWPAVWRRSLDGRVNAGVWSAGWRVPRARRAHRRR